MKAGTTSLYHYLRVHPQVFMAPIKELDFFVEDANWRRGWEWYRKQFERVGPEAIAVGEASTRYTKYPSVAGVPERIATHLPHARFIYVLRDPIERIRSHYEHRVAVGTERAPLEQAAFENPIYLDCSRYASQVERYLSYFSLESLLLITSEELRHSRASTMRRVYDFLRVDSDYVPGTLDQEFYKTGERATYSATGWRIRRILKRYFPASKRAKELVDSVLPRSLNRARGHADAAGKNPKFIVSESLRSKLAEQLRDDVRRLHSYMGEGFDGWGIA
jgi:hypothetical protein